jgi:hypothetical protein
MAEDTKPTDLTQLTASEWLMHISDDYNLTYHGNTVKEGGVEAGAALVPRNQSLPEVAVAGSLDPNGMNRASLSVGSDALRYSRQYEDGGEGYGGPRTVDTFEGGMGPVRGFYQKSSQPGNQDLRATAFGGQIRTGPLSLYANRSQSSQDFVNPLYKKYFVNPRTDNKTDQIGANLRVPVGSGTLTGGVGRQYQTNQSPQNINQASRPTAQSPNVTNYNLMYEGKFGPGQLNVGGNLTDVRGVGMEPSVRGSYDYPNPFGLGGNFSATGSLVKPIAGNTAAEAMLRYKLKF